MLLAYSWLMRWHTRSAPVRSTRTETPGNFASNALPIFSASGRSTEVYQTTLPSFFAASISAGVIELAGGAARTRVENCGASVAPSAAAPDCLMSSRRDQIDFFIHFLHFCAPRLFAQCAAALRRQMQPDCAAGRHVVFGRRHNAQRAAVFCFDHIIPAAAEKDLARNCRRNDVLRLRRISA